MNLSFDYEAFDSQGHRQRGSLSAGSERQALQKLRQQSLTVVRLSADRGDEAQASGGRLTREDITVAMFELASMLKSGVSAADAIGSQAQSAAHPKLRTAFSNAEKTLRHGGTFEQAMISSNLPLPDYVIYMIRAGELTGNLGGALQDASDQMKYDDAVRNEFKSALIYPTILVVSGVLAVVLMFVQVVPSFSNLLQEAENLPTLAWIVLSLGKWCNDNLVLFIVGLVLLPVLLAMLLARRSIRLRFLDALERVPAIGDWIRQSEIATWSRVMASLLKNKVDIVVALELAAQSVNIPSRKRRMEQVRLGIRSGKTLSASLEEHNCLNPTGYNMIRVGERAGAVAAMLGSLSEIYQEQGRQRMKRMLSLIEPIAILVIGSIMGLIIIGIMLAITSANDIPL